MTHLLNNLNESWNDCEEANLDPFLLWRRTLHQQKFDDGISILSITILSYRSHDEYVNKLPCFSLVCQLNFDIKVICLQDENSIQKETHTYIEFEQQSNATFSSLKRDLEEFDNHSKLFKDVNTDHTVKYK